MHCFGFDSLPPIPAPVPGFISSVSDTNSILLNVLAGNLTANLNIDPNPTNSLVVTGTGVMVNVLGTILTGFVPDNTPITAADTILIGFNRAQGQLNNKLDLSGGIMTGYLTLNADPVNALHAATKSYVDNMIYGVSWKKSARGATVSALPAYTVSGGGTVLTATVNGGFPITDGLFYVNGERILVKNEPGAFQPNNGGYTVTDAGSAGTPWILTRSDDANTSDTLLAATWRVREGTIEANKVYAINVSPIVMGVTNITMAQIAGAGVYTNGTYLSLTGNVFDIDFSTFSTTQVTEGLNQYFTTARARLSISAPVGPIVYNNLTGVISIPAATALVDGYLTSVDWNIFNSKEPAIGILPVSKGGTGINATVDTRIFFADGTNTFAQNSGLAYQKTTTAAGGILQLGGNTYSARTGLAATIGGGAFYAVADLVSANVTSFHPTTPTTTNYVLSYNTTNTQINSPSASGSLLLRIGATNVLQTVTANAITFTPAAATIGAADVFTFTAPASTGQTAATETICVNFNLSATISHASNTTIPQNRDFNIAARTHAFATAGGVITDAATLYINSAPIAGTNATITNGMSIWAPSGNVNLGNAPRTSQRLVRIGQDTATVDIGSLVGSTALGAIYLSNTPGAGTYAIAGNAATTFINGPSSIAFRINGAIAGLYSLTPQTNSWTPVLASSGAVVPFAFTTGASTNQTASTETIAFNFNSSATIQHATGALATNRDFLIQARTHSFVGASTITNAATLAITSAPIAGTNATITNSYAIWVQSGVSRFDGNISINDAINVILGTATGTKFGTSTAQKIGFWNATPIVQPTTAIAAAAFATNTSLIADDSATFDGYTIGQIVKALRDTGVLA